MPNEGHLHDLTLVSPELLGVGHVLVGHPDHVRGDPPHRHPEHDDQLDDVAGLQGVDADELCAIIKTSRHDCEIR